MLPIVSKKVVYNLIKQHKVLLLQSKTLGGGSFLIYFIGIFLFFIRSFSIYFRFDIRNQEIKGGDSTAQQEWINSESARPKKRQFIKDKQRTRGEEGEGEGRGKSLSRIQSAHFRISVL